MRTRILDAARQMFLSQGYDAVSMRRIADAIEYSATAIYVHFKDKEALIRELCREDFGKLATLANQLAEIPDPIERIRQLGNGYIKFAVQNPNHYRLMFMTASPVGPTAEDEQRKNDPDQDSYAFLVHTVREAMAAGRFRAEFDNVEVVAQTFWAAAHGIASLQVAKGTDPWIQWAPLEQRINVGLDAVLLGLSRQDLPRDSATPAPQPNRKRRSRGAKARGSSLRAKRGAK